MNEQQLADLFSEQLDRLLGGEATVDASGADDLPRLMNLGQQLSQVSFQPTPSALAMFQSQLISWFGPSGGGLSPTIFGMSKNLILGIAAAITAIGAGIGLIMLLGAFWPDVADHELPAPVTTGVPAVITAESPQLPVLDTSEEAEPTPRRTPSAVPTTSLGNTLSGTNNLQGDTLPSATAVRGDTLPPASATPTPVSTESTADPVDTVTGESDEDDRDRTKDDDHDRGHGNDPDGLDADNTGNSSGLPDQEVGGKDNNMGQPDKNSGPNSGGGNDRNDGKKK